MYRFEIVKLWSFAQMNSQGSTNSVNRVHYGKCGSGVCARWIMLENEAWWWDFLVKRTWPGLGNPGNFCLWNPESGKFIFFGIQNPGLWNPEYSSKKKFTLKSWIQMQAPLTKNLGSRIHGVESKNQDCLGFPYMDRDQWRIRGRGPGGPLPLFLDQTEVRRAENKFWDRPPPPYLTVWMTGPPLLWRSVSASGDFSSQKSVLNLVNFEMFNSL